MMMIDCFINHQELLSLFPQCLYNAFCSVLLKEFLMILLLPQSLNPAIQWIFDLILVGHELADFRYLFVACKESAEYLQINYSSKLVVAVLPPYKFQNEQ